MAIYKAYNYDQLVLIPKSLENQLELGTLEYIINELVENELGLSVFEGRYQNDDTCATAINPKVLLKVILFAYSRGMISSRQIEQACGENILFMALSCGYTCTAPHLPSRRTPRRCGGQCQGTQCGASVVRITAPLPILCPPCRRRWRSSSVTSCWYAPNSICWPVAISVWTG
jgi:hypothetical protein